MAFPSRTPLHQFTVIRTFVNAKVRWVRDPYLDTVVEKEKDLKQSISVKNQILSSPSQSISLHAASLLKTPLNLPTTTAKFVQKYPSLFSQSQPTPRLPPRLKLTPLALILHKEESILHNTPAIRQDTVNRLAKLLMLAGVSRLPFYVIDKFKWDLGLPHNFVTSLLSDYPEYFQVCGVGDDESLGLELVSWRKELAWSELEARNRESDGKKRRHEIAFPISFPKGFDLEKRVSHWVEEWQKLPYISPYENAFHLAPRSDLAEKWTVAVLHELLWLLVSKKTERENLLCLGDYLGFGSSFKKALVHHPGMFYVSNKLSTQTVVLREAYRKDFLVVKHPLMGMRYRYIHLMNKPQRQHRPAIVSA